MVISAGRVEVVNLYFWIKGQCVSNDGISMRAECCLFPVLTNRKM